MFNVSAWRMIKKFGTVYGLKTCLVKLKGVV